MSTQLSSTPEYVAAVMQSAVALLRDARQELYQSEVHPSSGLVSPDVQDVLNKNDAVVGALEVLQDEASSQFEAGARR